MCPAPFAVLSCQIAFDSDPLDETPVWEDVSDYLRSFTVDRGRQRELDRYQTGRMSVVLDNRDRRFDSEWAAGPYVGKILPAKRIRLRAVWDAVTYPVFDGFVDSWEDHYVYPNEANVIVTCSDGFKTLAQADLASSVYAQLVQEDGPVAWWRLDENGGETAHDAAGKFDLTARGAVLPELGQETLVARDPGGSAELGDGVTFDAGFTREGVMPLTGGPLTIEAVVRSTAVSGDELVAGNVTYFAGTGAFLGIEDGFGFIVATSPGAAQVTQVSGTSLAGDGILHHLMGVWNGDGTLKLWVDGVDRTVGTPTLTIGAFNQTTGTSIIGAFDQDGMTGNIDEVAFYDYALDPSRILLHAQAVTGPWAGDTSGVRIGRVLDAVGWPTSERAIDTGDSTLQSADINGSAFDHVQKVRDSEGGELFMSADGKVTFKERSALVNQTSQGTFGDNIAVELEYSNIVYDYSDQLIRNDVTVSREEGLAQHARDTTSIGRFQRQSYVRDGLIHDSDGHSRNMAEYIVSQYANPKKRVAALTALPRRAPADLFPQVLGRELTDWVVVNRRPQGIGDPTSQTVVIEGISHAGNASTQEWETTWALSPAPLGVIDPGDVNVFFQWDVSRWDEHRWFY